MASCVEECFAAGNFTKPAMDKCYVYCLRKSVRNFSFGQIAGLVSHLELVCRDSDSLRIKMFNGEETATNLYLVRVGESDENSNRSTILMSSTGLVRLGGLKPNTQYTVTMVTLNTEHHVVHMSEQKQFKTLPVDYFPEAVTTIALANYTSNRRNKNLLNAIVSWEPATDRTCHYKILYRSIEESRGDYLNFHRVEQLFQSPIKSLDFATKYAIAVQAINPNYPGHSGKLQWSTFHTPSAADWHRCNTQLCAPMPITNVHVTAAHLFDDSYQINVNWTKPIFIPDFYVLKLSDLNPAANKTTFGLWNVSGDASSVFVKSFHIRGSQCGVFITAHANNRETTHSVILPINNSVKQLTTLEAIGIVLLITFITLSIFYTVINLLESYLLSISPEHENLGELENPSVIDTHSKMDHMLITIRDVCSWTWMDELIQPGPAPQGTLVLESTAV